MKRFIVAPFWSFLMSKIRNMIIAASLGFAVASVSAQTTDSRASRSDRAFQAELLSNSIAPEPATNSNTVLHVNGDLQFRYTANFGREDASRNDFEGGFSLPLTRLRFNGKSMALITRSLEPLMRIAAMPLFRTHSLAMGGIPIDFRWVSFIFHLCTRLT